MLEELMTAVPVSIIGSIVISALTFIVTKVYRRVGSRKLWRIKDYESVLIVTSLSVKTDTGTYSRPATGLGQVRALATIAPSLTRAGSDAAWQNLLVPSQCDGSDLEHDLILLGGPKNNAITEKYLELLNQKVLPTQVESEIILPDGNRHEGRVVDGEVVEDFGLILSTPNPYSVDSRAILFSGSHTFGTAAAAYWWTRKVKPNVFHNHIYAEIIRCRVLNNHIGGLESVWKFDQRVMNVEYLRNV